ncbi:MAG: acetate kinase [Desulfovibrionaceae bacterium]|jgi:acetate kinase|nr:acetate kinase [Desulfovibrionaceae bacterium]
MKILVINCGSSSLKYQLMDMGSSKPLCSGLIERIGDTGGAYRHKKNPDTEAEAVFQAGRDMPDHDAAMRLVAELLTDAEAGVVADVKEIDAVGHRVVHGGEAFNKPTLIDDAVLAAVKGVEHLAPLHNPANLIGIRVAMALFPHAPQVAVFDTAFHQTLPPKAYMYALPYDYYEELGIRRYGFHGTSHRYVAREGARCMGLTPKEARIITVHLGNGGSVAAVDRGKCVDTSMGLSPLAGLIMGTRCGDIDPAIIPFLAKNKNMSLEEVDTVLNKESGMKGICGVSDMRDVGERIAAGDERAALAMDMYAYRVRKYIGSYFAALGTLDGIVFTAGIGENDILARRRILEGLEGMGIVIDIERNKGRGGPKAIHADESRVQIWIIPTNEELEIANQTLEVLDNRDA